MWRGGTRRGPPPACPVLRVSGGRGGRTVDADPDQLPLRGGELFGGLGEQRHRPAPRNQPGEVGGELSLRFEVQGTRHMPLGEGDPVAQVDHPLPGGQPGGDLLGVRDGGRGEVDRRRPRGVGRPHVGVVRGNVVQAGQQAGDEAVDVPGERLVRGLLPADRGGPALGLAGGAEAAEAVRGEHRRVVRQLGGQAPRGGVLRPREVLGQPWLDQVGAADGADQQRAAGEHGDGRAVLLQHVGGVVRGVAGRRQCAQGQAGGGVDLAAVAVVHGDAVVGDAGPGGDEVGGARDAGQFQAAGDVVVVDVRLDDLGYPHPRRAAAAITRSMSRGGSTTTAVRPPPAR